MWAMELTQAPSSPGKTSDKKTSGKKESASVWRWLWIGLLVLILGLVGLKAGKIGLHTWRFYRHAAALNRLVVEGITPQRLPQAQPLLRGLSQDLGGLEREIRPFTPLLRRLDGVTEYGSTLAYAPELLRAGASFTGVAADGLALVAPALADPGEQPLHVAALAALADQDPAFEVMAVKAERGVQALEAIPEGALHPRLAQPLATVRPLLPLAAPGLRMAPALPKLLGIGEPFTYLLLLQNNQEIRATGGFITGVGRVTLAQASPTEMLFTDSYKVDNRSVSHPPAPQPMQQFMNVPTMFLRDVNWSPDFPTTAQLARAMYQRDQGVLVGGVVSVDLHAVQILFDGLGPLTLPGIEEPVTGRNVVDIIKALWNSPLGETPKPEENFGQWWQNRKSFMPLMAQAFLVKLESGDFSRLALLQAGIQAMNQRAVQVWVDDPRVMAQLAKLGWDGGLHPLPGGDFLAVVDSNLGFNKVDAVIERRLDYQVTWPDGPGNPALAVARVTYRHPLELPDHRCDLSPRYGDTYDEMTRRCYFDFVRLYAPLGSQLASIDGIFQSTLLDKPGPQETQVFGGFFVLDPGKEHTVTFTYRLPPEIQPSSYRLLVQRQAGTQALPFTWDVDGVHGEALIQDGRFLWSREQAPR